MDEIDSPRLAGFRHDYFAALQHANEETFSPEAFLSAFPPNASDGHQDILLRLRQNLLQLVERGYQAAFDIFLQSSDIANHFKLLDRATLNDAALSGAMSDVSEDVALEKLAEANPVDRLVQARVASKQAEIARLEVLVIEKESGLSALRAKVSSTLEEFSRLQEDILTRVQASVVASQTLSRV